MTRVNQKLRDLIPKVDITLGKIFKNYCSNFAIVIYQFFSDTKTGH